MLEAVKISKSYTPHISNSNVLNGISFKIHSGEVFSILGKNGAGKSTLIKILTTLLKSDSGTVLFNGKDIDNNINAYKKKIGVVFERSDNLYDYLNIRDNLLYFGGLMGMCSKEILSRSETLLKKFDLFEHKEKTIAEYSQGMMQKASIITAMLSKPELLFLDEPTLGLDIISKRKIITEIKKLAGEEGISVILTSHQLDVVEQVSDRVMILSGHRIVFLGSVEELKRRHSQNKYLLRIKKENFPKNGLSFPEISTINENHECFLIELFETEGFDFNKVIMKFMELNIPLEGFSKESSSLEDIMVEYLEEENV